MEILAIFVVASLCLTLSLAQNDSKFADSPRNSAIHINAETLNRDRMRITF